MNQKSLLLIFAKNPELGKAKTRLAKTIGDEKALWVYRELLQHTKKITQDLPTDKVVFYTSFIDENDLWQADIYQKKLQIEGSLGEKMAQAFEWGFRGGYEKIIIIGTDCYELTTEILEIAFEKLNQNETVIGPAQDGGYYLLGLNEVLPEVFQNKEWSTASVLRDTIQDLENLQVSYDLLPLLRDIDDFDDLKNTDLLTKLLQ